MQAKKSEREQLLADLQTVRQAMVRDLFVLPLPPIGGRELSLTHMAALMLLGDGAARSVKATALALGRSISATSRLLDVMVKARLLQRREDPSDRRARQIEVTAAGRALITTFLERRTDAQLALMQELDADERAKVLEGMALLAAAARRRRP